MRQTAVVDDRPKPKPGRLNAVLSKEQAEVAELRKAEVLVIRAKFAMWWNGLLLNAGSNVVLRSTYAQLPEKIRGAVGRLVEEGALTIEEAPAAKPQAPAVPPAQADSKPPTGGSRGRQNRSDN
jgi:hypothetical protein